MSDYLRVSLVQTNIIWEDVQGNLKNLTTILDNLKDETDLIILPETFTSGFTMQRKEKVANYAEYTLEWMQNYAEKKKATILGSIIIKDENRFFNRLLAIAPDGQIEHYDKRHLFRMGNEHLHFAYGKKPLIFNIGKWRIRPLICYDLRFPVWSRNCNNYDLLIYIANWPKSRRNVWNTLLKARAIENMSYVVGVNRIGTDAMNLDYSGDTIALDAKAKTLCSLQNNKEEIQTVTLSLNELHNFRDKFPTHKDSDSFEIFP